MTVGEERRSPVQRERRGLDPAILTFIHAVLDDHAESHRREHELVSEAMNAALVKADEKLEDLGARLREHYDTILEERDSRYNERHNASQAALKEAAASAQEAIRTALRTAREETNKTEANWVKTADATFVKIDQLQTAFSKAVPREESDRTQEDNNRRFGELAERLTAVEAAKAAKAESQFDMRAWMVAFVSLIALAVTVAVAFGGNGT